MSRLVLCTGFGTSKETAERTARKISDAYGTGCRVFTYPSAIEDPDIFRDAVAGADLCWLHSQATERLRVITEGIVTAINPPSGANRLAIARRTSKVAIHFLFEVATYPKQRLLFLKGCAGELALRGVTHLTPFMNGSVTSIHQEYESIADRDGVELTLVQAVDDELFPEKIAGSEKLRVVRVKASHNTFIHYPNAVLSQLSTAA